MTELFGVHGLMVAIVALLVIGPKDLPKALRVAGYWVGKARGVTRQFRQGFDNMIREAELEEMEKKWRAENERIMREHPADASPIFDAADESAAPVEPSGTVEQLVTVEQPVMVEHPVVAPSTERMPPPADSAPS